jgi:hypothetical protein
MRTNPAKLPEPCPCPWCGEIPIVRPQFPEREGNAWGEVECNNPDCPAQPSVCDGIDVADSRGSDAYKRAAIERWNTWQRGL